MEETSKDAEIRARVTAEMHQQLSAIASGRGEQLPVILREAVAEYLARRATKPVVFPSSNALLDALRDRPDVADTLIALGRVLKAGDNLAGGGIMDISKPDSPHLPPVPPSQIDTTYHKRKRKKGRG